MLAESVLRSDMTKYKRP